MKRLIAVFGLAVGTMCVRGEELPDGWSPQFYPGLEAVGSVEWLPKAYKDKAGAIRCVWQSGAMKFGVKKEVTTEFSGWVDWTVEAHVMSEGDYGYAGAAMEFLDANGRSVGFSSQLKPIVAKGGWRKAVWTFSSPKAAKRFQIHLLSLDKEPVRFANMRISSKQGADKGDIPFEVMALPAEKNRWWAGGSARALNFSDAPIPTVFYMKGEKKGRDRLRLVIDVPAELELKDAYCPNGAFYEAVRPLETSRVFTNGADCIRYSFGDLRLFKEKQYGCLSPVRYFNDECSGLALVLGPKAGQEDLVKTFRIGYRMMLDGKCGEEKAFDMKFRPLPKNLKRSKDFFVFSWNNADRHFASDAAANAALYAFEAAGFRSFNRNPHGGNGFTRKAELVSLLEKRPVPYIFALHLGDVWKPRNAGFSPEEAKAFGVRMSVSSDVRYKSHANAMCPEYFTKDEKLQAHLRSYVHRQLRDYGVKDNEWILFDMEPWHSYSYCHCDECHKAFAAYAGLDHVPTAAETQSTAELRDKWALFRCSHNAKSVELLVKYIHEYNPTLRAIDYDYVMPYGDEQGMMARRRSVAKDTLVNEQWLDGHLCSYYHKIDKVAFDAIRNDTRYLKKFYVPMGANDGAGGYLTPAEILNPKQVRQLALAAFVHGCPGIAFYSGICYDGGYLLGLMSAQNDIAAWESLPWGKAGGVRDGEDAIAVSESAQFAYASTVKPDGTKVLALFNYDPEETIRVRVAGETYEVAPYDVRFVEGEK